MLNERRARKLIAGAIERLELRMDGLTVLTEAATGAYALTPLIAALAGARQVLALTRDSRFGRAIEVEQATLELARRWGVDGRVDILHARDDPRIADADVVTNLGFVRPIDATLLGRLKPTAAIALMWETWEFRPEDLDLPECRRLGIPLLGTDEHHPDLRIFEYVGHIALKLLFEAQIEVFRSKVVVLGHGEFAERTANALQSAGADVARLDVGPARLPFTDAARHVLRDADALVVVEHQERRMLLGAGADVEARALCETNPALVVVHICGGVDRGALVAAGLHCHPERFSPAGHMSVGTDYLGPRPLVDLHAAGLKVGALLTRARMAGLAAFEAEMSVLRTSSLAQGFSGYHGDASTTAAAAPAALPASGDPVPVDPQ